MAPERVGGGAGEVGIGLLQRELRVGGREPEHGVRTGEGAVDDRGVAVRSGDHVDAVANGGREPARVTDDDADRFAGIEQVPDDVAADVAGGCGDDDHEETTFRVLDICCRAVRDVGW